MNRQVIAGALVGAVLAGLWVAADRQPPTPLAQAQSSEVVTAQQEVAPVAGEAQFQRAAGEEYRAADVGLEAIKASLAPLWRWDGDEGTYVDGRTRVRVVTQDGTVTGFEIIVNESAISDACLEAQLLYGISVDGAGVAAACAGMWTQAWAEAQAGADE